ncbi:MAG: hypothetical protein Q8M40_00635 [Legionella sp.]|nr:hypothetical protein [Legionella sp.]
MPNIWTESAHSLCPHFIEAVRRIPNDKALLIQNKMNEVTRVHFDQLQKTLTAPDCLFNQDSFMRDEMFPYTVLQALKDGEISSLRFGTLMKLWGRMREVLPVIYQAEFIPLFLNDGSKNPRAIDYLRQCLSSSISLPNMTNKSSVKLREEIFKQAQNLSRFDQGFYFTKNRTDKIRYIDNPNPLNRAEYFSNHTITQEAKKSTGLHFLDFPAQSSHEIVAGFELEQLCLSVYFPNPVRINPVIGISSVDDIRQCSLERYRDVQIAFPENELPQKADCFPAPSSLDYVFHDEYHCMRSSRVTPSETKTTVKIGDQFRDIQRYLNSVIKDFTVRHKYHLEKLPEFGAKIEKFPLAKQEELKKIAYAKYLQEASIIATLKHLSLSIGQLKFRLYDMERYLSGSLYDNSPLDSVVTEIVRIIANIEADLNLIGKPQGSNPLLPSFSRIVAHAVLNALQLELSLFNQFKERMNYERLLPIIKISNPNIHQFYSGISDWPKMIADREKHQNFVSQVNKKVDYYVERALLLKQKGSSEKAQLYEDITKIHKDQLETYLQAQPSNESRKKFIEAIESNVKKLEVSPKINEGRNIIARALRWIEAIAVFFGLRPAKETQKIKVSEHNSMFQTPKTRTVQNLLEIVNGQQNFAI